MNDLPPPYDTVFFDCDSTLSAMEGIEELFGQEREELVRLTALAMDGAVPLEEVYGRRLELARPTRADMERIGALYVERRLAHSDDLVRALRFLGKRVGIVSGGLLPPVRRLAEHLGIDEVHAVDLRFDEAGAYAGFEEDSPLARAGGKPELLGSLEGTGAAVLVGDGATDLEAAGVCARFVAFGAVEHRDKVFAGAAVGTDGPDFRALVPLLLAEDERAALAADGGFAALLS